MSNYSNTYGGAAKDTANAVILGADHDTQYDNLATMSATKADKVGSATNGNIFTMDANGNLQDSGVAIGAITSAELALLGGLTSTTAELNILDGVTATATELNYVSGVTSSLSPVVIDTPVTLSGTSATFSAIPSWVTKITVSFSGLSVDGSTGDILLRLGDSGGIETTGYLGSIGRIMSSTPASASATNGFYIMETVLSGTILHGSIDLTLVNSSTNTWVCSGVMGRSDSAGVWLVGGSKPLSATLTQLSIVSTIQSFDAGEANIRYS